MKTKNENIISTDTKGEKSNLNNPEIPDNIQNQEPIPVKHEAVENKSTISIKPDKDEKRRIRQRKYYHNKKERMKNMKIEPDKESEHEENKKIDVPVSIGKSEAFDFKNNKTKIILGMIGLAITGIIIMFFLKKKPAVDMNSVSDITIKRE